MDQVGIFYGSDTGNTEKISYIIQKIIGISQSNVFDISNISLNKMEDFNILFLGISTWYYGELQCDWEESLQQLKKINLKNKIVALFGCGDQEDYSEYFCDAIGIMYHLLKKKSVQLVGSWPITDYYFEFSKAQKNKTHFFGLPLDEDNQSHLSNQRIKRWLKLVNSEINILHSNNKLN
ncbi:Flavodoxin 1 [Buchnera aphidicola (Cinara kochiana kochiana)]|uniref:Flavodoxin n=1 Tax=Buchnera aphidicola (Cinara kochiana kochiana) TaxID=2518976 RepID=A0A451D5P2_9GAMM|nr:flavodoxin [Buchnera aphidicola]VFP81107.1 Flavodoxin 1 [Buchnera aphidicola (Cinara kochiana kochiana)]